MATRSLHGAGLNLWVSAARRKAHEMTSVQRPRKGNRGFVTLSMASRVRSHLRDSVCLHGRAPGRTCVPSLGTNPFPSRVWSGILKRVMTSQAESTETSPGSNEGLSTSQAGQQGGPAEGSENQGLRHGAHAELVEVLNLVDEKKGVDVVVLNAEEYKAMKTLCRHMVILTCVSRYISFFFPCYFSPSALAQIE
jgi:hypothetical protein